MNVSTSEANLDIVIVPLFRRDGSRHELILDKEDYDKFKHYYIGLIVCSGRFYARIKYNSDKMQLLHRVILNAPKDLEVDHENNNGLDNRRCNISLVSHFENCQNIHVTRGVSNIRGITWNARQGKWHARVGLNYKQHHLGFFLELEDAVKAVKDFNTNTVIQEVQSLKT